MAQAYAFTHHEGLEFLPFCMHAFGNVMVFLYKTLGKKPLGMKKTLSTLLLNGTYISIIFSL